MELGVMTPTNLDPARAQRLEAKDLHAYYGESHVLQGVSLHVEPGEIVALLGRNGAGKTTILRSIMGAHVRRTGSISYGSQELIGLAQHLVPRLGIAYVPEERGIFASLSVDENLVLPPAFQAGGIGVDEIHCMFPNLKGRGRTPGTWLSGGEQQMLAIARVLRTPFSWSNSTSTWQPRWRIAFTWSRRAESRTNCIGMNSSLGVTTCTRAWGYDNDRTY